MVISPALQRGVAGPITKAGVPQGRRHNRSPKHVTFIIFDSIVPRKRDKFLLEIAFEVMLFLVLNVLLHDLNLRGADDIRQTTTMIRPSAPTPPAFWSIRPNARQP